LTENAMDYDSRHQLCDDLGYENLYRDEEPRDVDWDSWLDEPAPDWSHDDADIPVFPKADDVMQDGEITEGV